MHTSTGKRCQRQKLLDVLCLWLLGWIWQVPSVDSLANHLSLLQWNSVFFFIYYVVATHELPRLILLFLRICLFCCSAIHVLAFCRCTTSISFTVNGRRRPWYAPLLLIDLVGTATVVTLSFVDDLAMVCLNELHAEVGRERQDGAGRQYHCSSLPHC